MNSVNAPENAEGRGGHHLFASESRSLRDRGPERGGPIVVSDLGHVVWHTRQWLDDVVVGAVFGCGVVSLFNFVKDLRKAAALCGHKIAILTSDFLCRRTETTLQT